jgi:nucleotide-binding universal stress UspA family protein
MKIKTILVPTDFSKDAEKALQTAIELAKTYDARIEVLHAYHVDIPVMSPMAGAYALPAGFYDGIQKHAEAQVAKVVSDAGGAGVKISGRAIERPASMAIVAEAESLPADLIVMGTRGVTGLKHVLLGSVAERTIRTALCPVLIVKADA